MRDPSSSIALVLVGSAVLFAVGSQIERNTETTAESNTSSAELRHETNASAGSGTTHETGAGGDEQTGHNTSERSRAKAASDTSDRGKAAGQADTGQAAEGAGTREAGQPADNEEATQNSDTGRAAATAASAGSADGSRPSTGESAERTPAGNEPDAADSQSTETAAEHHSEIHNEAKLFGINPEAVGLVIAAVLVSLLLAGAIWMRPITVVLLAAVGFGVVFAGFDVREVLHQVDESRAGLIAIAGVLVGLHLLVALLAATELLRARSRRPATV